MRGGLGAALVLLVLTAGSAPAQLAPSCTIAGRPMAIAELMFGRNAAGRLKVTEAQWSRFLDREITPRFPDGLTVVDAKGQWRDRSRNVIVREPSKLVTIVLPGRPDDGRRLRRIVEAYKARFRQQSVGLIVRPACVLF